MAPVTSHTLAAAVAASMWTNIATKLSSCASDLDKARTGRLAGQEFLAVAAFKTLQASSASHLRMTGQLAGAISGGLTAASMIVRVVYDMICNTISDVIGKLVSKVAIGVLAADLTTPRAVDTAIAEVSSQVTRLSEKVADTVLPVKNLRGLLTKVNHLLDDVAAVSNRIPTKVSRTITTKMEIVKGLVSSLSNPQYALAGLSGISMYQAGNMGRAKPTIHRPTSGPKPPKISRPNPSEGRWGQRPDGAPTESDPKPTTSSGEGTPPKGEGNRKGGDGGDPVSGSVVFKPFKGASEADVKTFHEYVAGRNQALREGELSPTGRIATKNTEIDRQTKRAARQERWTHPEKYPSPNIVAGHVPDSAWLGHGSPPSWQAMPFKLNSSLARQDNNYPIGYKPTKLLVGEGD